MEISPDAPPRIAIYWTWTILVLLIILLISGCLYYWWRRKRRKNQDQQKRLRLRSFSQVMDTAWSVMWNVTDETPANSERFLDRNGMEVSGYHYQAFGPLIIF